MPDLTIDPVRTAADLESVAIFPWTVYRGDRWWVPPLLSERRKLVSREHFPFFQHSQAEFFVAKRGGQVVGTVAGIANRRYNEFHASNVGWFGFFEVLDDPEAAVGLLATAADWGRQQGFTALLGPAQYSTNEETGLLIDGFDDAPRIMMTYNPRRYLGYMEQAGYTKAMDLFAYRESIAQFHNNIPPKLARVVDKVQERGKFTLRKVNMKRFDQEIEHVKRLYNSSWERNWGFVPMTDREIDHLAAQFKPVVIPDCVPIVEKDGVPIGFGLALSDLNVVLRSNRQGWLLPVLPRLLWALKRETIRRARVLLLGVIPEWRGRGIDAILYHWLWAKAGQHGMPWGEGSWVLEDNPAMNAGLVKLGMRHYKTLRMYDRPT